MRTFRRITLFCAFAVVGAGLAVWVGFSITSSPNRRQSHPQNLSGEESTRAPSDVEWLLQPPLRAPDLAAVQPTWAAPSEPVPAPTYPARTQQFVPEGGDSRLQKVFQYVQRQLGSNEDATATDATPADNADQTPPDEAAADPEPPASQAVIDEEGDGKLTIHIQDADIREVLGLLGEEGNLNILAGTSVQGKVSATLRGVDVEGALDAILKSKNLVARREGKFIFVGTPADFDSMERAMDKLATRVYRPNYVTAAELEQLITPLLTEDGKISVTSPAESGIGTDTANTGGDKFAGGDVLVVSDYEAVLTQIDQVVAEIDIRPMQVHIEAMILGVVLNDGNDFGVNFEFLRNKDHAKLGWGNIPGDSETTLNDSVDIVTQIGENKEVNETIKGLTKVALIGTGLKFGFLDDNLGVFLNALESIGDTNVIATPRLLVLNKQRAEIHIGGEEGYRGSVSSTETSTMQEVSMLETGTRLRLRPFISSDGMIRMEVHPELSSGEVKLVGNDALPTKTTTQVTTNIMVRDGCTVVIGGLLDEELVTLTTQIPLLGSLPVVGVLFRNKNEMMQRREIIVLITPRIVHEPGTCQEGDKAAGEFHRRQAVYADKMSLLGKRSVARRYFRMAQDAWAAGQRRQALRFIDLSVHFDPLNRAALDLQSDIWAGSQHGEHTLGAEAWAEPPLSPMDGETIPGWLLEDLEQLPSADHQGAPLNGRASQPAPLHPLDSGRPGSRTEIVRPRRLR